jgi:biotin/methionine sulfoxide reductase
VTLSHSSHWGAFNVEVRDDSVSIHPSSTDPDPSPLLGNIEGSLRSSSRVLWPSIRRGWLEDGPGPDERRGADEFVRVDWDTLGKLLAQELQRVKREHGSSAIFGGSYGWGSAGRFHHAQSQIHRFLNCFGGYTASVGTYSYGASQVIMPHVVGANIDSVHGGADWSSVVENAQLVVAFGGLPTKNLSVAPGGITRHSSVGQLRRLSAAKVETVIISPISDDVPAGMTAQQIFIRPATDIALMLAIAHTLISEKLYDRAFIDRYCVGFETFADYVLGEEDGQAKDPDWGSEICQVPPDVIVKLARLMARRRTMITMTWSLQRAEHGEQLPWLGLVLAAMTGDLGLPGRGFGHGFGSTGDVGSPALDVPLPSLEQGRNPLDSYIPVARIADMLLSPGAPFDFDGQKLTYPEIRLVYWCGGNPFHHHQDLARLRRAFMAPDTVVVHESFWTATAKNADIVVPTTVTLEREDLGASRRDPWLVAMHRAVPPAGEARDDFATFSDLAHRLGFGDEFTEGREVGQWLRHLYSTWRLRLATSDMSVPPFEEFWDLGRVELPRGRAREVYLGDFRKDPVSHPLATPSGRIEITSATIEGFVYPDCAGHPRWYEPIEWLGGALADRYPLHLIANQPRTRLHSQLDMGAYSQASKIEGREPMRLNPADAEARGISTGDIVRVFNDRGSCLAGAILDEGIRIGVVQLSTGAWYDPEVRSDVRSMCVHGNPNVLTSDRATSRLAQATAGQHALVEVKKFEGTLPTIRAYDPPAFIEARHDADPLPA